MFEFLINDGKCEHKPTGAQKGRETVVLDRLALLSSIICPRLLYTYGIQLRKRNRRGFL